MSWLNRLLNNNRFLMVVSFLSAVVIWFTVAVVYSPQINKTITGIPIEVSFGGSTDGQYHAYYATAMVANAEVSGKKYIVNQLNAASLKVSANIDSVTSSGMYTLDLIAQEGDYDVVSISPSTISVLIDVERQKEFTVEVEPIAAQLAQLENANENLLLETSFANEANRTLKITGPETQVNKIAYAKLVAQGVSSNEQLTKSKEYNAGIVLYDSQDNVLHDCSTKTTSLEYISLSYETATVMANVTMRKVVPLQWKYDGAPANPSVTLQEITGSQTSEENFVSTISIKGPVEKIQEIDHIQLEGVVDYSKIVPNDPSSYQFKLELPTIDPDITYDEYANVTDLYFLATVSNQGVTYQTFDIPANLIQVTNLPAEYTATVQSSLKGITVMGPSSCVSTVTPEALLVEVDASTISGVWASALKADITIINNKNCWISGRYTVVVEIGRK